MEYLISGSIMAIGAIVAFGIIKEAIVEEMADLNEAIDGFNDNFAAGGEGLAADAEENGDGNADANGNGLLNANGNGFAAADAEEIFVEFFGGSPPPANSESVTDTGGIGIDD